MWLGVKISNKNARNTIFELIYLNIFFKNKKTNTLKEKATTIKI